MSKTEPGLGLRQPLAITATGMVTGVGLNTASTCAAIRAAIDNFQETRFMDSGGEWILGCEVALEEPWRGTRKLAKMLAQAVKECVQQASADISSTPLLLCLAESERPGRPDRLANRVFFETQEELDLRFHPDSTCIEHGRVGGLVALQHARRMLYEGAHSQVIVAGVDSLLNAASLRVYEERHRLLTSRNSDGFIPGEGAGAILIEAASRGHSDALQCFGLGFGVEQATLESDSPLRADGLTNALKQAFQESDTHMDNMDFRIVDVAGEQYWFKESALVIGRFLRIHKQQFPLLHLTDCIGETGAAIGPLSIAYLKTAFEKDFAPGPNALQHISNDDGKRGGAVFRYCSIRDRASFFHHTSIDHG